MWIGHECYFVKVRSLQGLRSLKLCLCFQVFSLFFLQYVLSFVPFNFVSVSRYSHFSSFNMFFPSVPLTLPLFPGILTFSFVNMFFLIWCTKKNATYTHKTLLDKTLVFLNTSKFFLSIFRNIKLVWTWNEVQVMYRTNES